MNGGAGDNSHQMDNVAYTATALAPGSCGELVQGTFHGENFLVTCPIPLYSQVTVRLFPPGSASFREGLPRGELHNLAGDPYLKTQMALRKTLDFLGLKEWMGKVIVRSPLLRAKGMASSTADISATALATAEAYGVILPPEEIARIALSIEPSDGIMFPGIVMFDHLTGRFVVPFGDAPSLEILVFDYGGQVDTITFNSRPELSALNEAKEGKVREALAEVEEGLRRKDLRLVGSGATKSALANQDILFKPQLEEIVESAFGQLGAVGVSAAHSGTVIGVLFEELTMETEERVKMEIMALWPNLTFLFHTRLANGGVKLEYTPVF